MTLIEGKADVNSTGNLNRETALHLAVIMQNIGLVRILLCAEADVRCRNGFGRNALDIATSLQNEELVSMMETHMCMAHQAHVMRLETLRCLANIETESRLPLVKDLVDVVGGFVGDFWNIP